MRIAAIGDLHCRVDTPDLIRQIMGEIEREADVLVLTGDLTDSGQPAEMEEFIRQLSQIPLPAIAILGNHDHQGGYAEELGRMLLSGGIHLLDASAYTIGEVGFVGTKGFCGGFGDNLVQPFGELALKAFINTSIDETAQFEEALAGLESKRRVAVLHYSPVRETVVGESPEIYPFLGTSRLAEAIDRHGVDVIVHGHSHHGYVTGKTPGNIPVYNVCRFVQAQYTGRPYCVLDI